MANNDTVIEFKDVSKIYKLYKNDRARLMGSFFKSVPYIEKKAVNKVSFEIKRGEAVALFGRNGAGKSTILKMITGVTFPTKGTVNVLGRVSALLELTAGFDRAMSGRSNIYLKGRLMGLSAEEIKSREADIIEFANIGDYIDQPVRMYSSGMKARLGFAINVNIDPEILIVDEALSVGDKLFKEKCVEKVNEIMQKKNVTLLFVTHSTTTAKEFCKRGIVLKDGKLILDGDIDSAIAKYEDLMKKKKKVAEDGKLFK